MKDFRGVSFDPENKPVSIGVASYNNALYVLSTLESIYSQTYAPIELTIVDDRSTDNSVSLIRHWLEQRGVSASFIVNNENLGICKVCNLLLENVFGHYFVLISSDDEMERDRIEKQVNRFNSLGPDYGLLYSDMSTMDEQGNPLDPSWFKTKKLSPLSGDIFDAFLKEQFRFPSPTIIYKTEVFKFVGKYDEQLKTEDIDMILRILSQYKAEYVDIVAIRYRVRSTSLSRNIGGKFYEDRISIYRKFLGINKSLDRYIRNEIASWANSAYKVNYHKSGSLLLTSLKLKFRLQNFYFWLFTLIGIRIGNVSKVIKFFKG